MKYRSLFLVAILTLGLVPQLVFAATTTPDAVAPIIDAPLVAPTPIDTEQVTGEGDANANSDAGSAYERAVVESVTMQNKQTGTTGQQVEVYRVRFLSGPLDGQSKDISGDAGSNPYALDPGVGDKVVIFMQPSSDNGYSLYLEGFDRRAAMIWLVVLFVLTQVLLAGWQGVKVTFSIFISVGIIGYVLIPLFLKGVNPIPVAIVLSGVFTMLSAGLSTGWNKKSLMTAIGTVGGALVALLIAYLFAKWAHLSGLSSDEDRMFFDKNPLLNPQGLLFAGIIIASAGVVEDVAVSITSGVSEVKRANPRAHFRQLFQSGMVVGKDHMSALANTLIFAYVGASLSTLLLYSQFGGSWLKFVNFDSVVDEIIRALSGTIGLVFTVPITALLSAWVMHNDRPDLDGDPSSHSHIHSH